MRGRLIGRRVFGCVGGGRRGMDFWTFCCAELVTELLMDYSVLGDEERLSNCR